MSLSITIASSQVSSTDTVKVEVVVGAMRGRELEGRGGGEAVCATSKAQGQKMIYLHVLIDRHDWINHCFEKKAEDCKEKSKFDSEGRVLTGNNRGSEAAQQSTKDERVVVGG